MSEANFKLSSAAVLRRIRRSVDRILELGGCPFCAGRTIAARSPLTAECVECGATALARGTGETWDWYQPSTHRTARRSIHAQRVDAPALETGRARGTWAMDRDGGIEIAGEPIRIAVPPRRPHLEADRPHVLQSVGVMIVVAGALLLALLIRGWF